MSLQFVVDTLDAVPENVRTLYQPDGDKFRLAVDGYEDPSGLKSALQKERDAAKAAKAQANAWASIGKTPEEIQSLLESQRKADEDRSVKSGEWEKLKAQMQEQFGNERAKLDMAIKAKQAAIEKYLIDSHAVSAISELKGVPALLLPHVKSAVKVVDVEGEYVTRVIDAAGNPRINAKGDYLTIKDLVSEMRQSEVFGRAFEPSGVSGSGAQGGSGSGHKQQKSRAQFEAMPTKDRAAFAKEISAGKAVLTD